MSDMDIVSTGEEDVEFQQNHQGGQSYPKSELRNARAPDNSGPKRMVDITRDKPIKVTIRVVVPVRDHPKFNFVGKLLGPKGNSLKRLQEDTMTKMAILGRGSMKDRHKEPDDGDGFSAPMLRVKELRGSGDPKFSHLLEELHVEVTAFAPPAEAHARIAYALAEVRRFLVPDYNDEIRQEQMWEMAALNSGKAGSGSSTNGSGSGTGTNGNLPLCGGSVSSSSAPLCTGEDSNSAEACGGNSSVGGSSTACEASPRSASGTPPHSIEYQLGPTPVSPKNPLEHQFFGKYSIKGLVPCRKRPLVAGNSRISMSPTKRTVLSILARARAAQTTEIPQPQQYPPIPYAVSRRALVGIPGLREDSILSAGNILIN